MAGKPSLLFDPAFEKFYHMRENTQHYFKLTPRVVAISSTFLIGIPALIYYTVKNHSNKIEYAGVKRGDSIWKQ
ncbi:hypothetical protein BC833DRAFT_575104 [Globomyces pollinis-pini]|nr:hypothetical protein BC833DRAFT_575104 [Globomyces pollinis-pini]